MYMDDNKKKKKKIMETLMQTIRILKSLATLVDGDPKAPFSIATTLRYRNGAAPFQSEYSNEFCVEKEESHQRGIHLGSPSCKILRAILEMDKGRNSANAPEDS